MDAAMNGAQSSNKVDEEEARRQKRAVLKELNLKQAGKGT